VATAAVEITGAIGSGLLLVHGRPDLRPSLRVVPRVGVAAVLGATPALAEGLPILVRVLLSTFIYGVVLISLKALPVELLALVPARLRMGR
jgi:hypothetical protein